MPLQWSRYTALLFAVGLGIGEAVINSLDPDMAIYNFSVDRTILILVELMLVIAALGVVTSFLALRKSKL